MPRAQIPSLETRRLRLEALAASHSSGMFELWREPAVCEHSGGAVDSGGAPIDLPARVRSESDRILEFWLDRARAGTGFRWAVLAREADTFVGAVGFNSLGRVSELAYHLVPRYWGRGLAAEAAGAALDWSFSHGARLVECYVEPANTRSIELVERLGFSRAARPEGSLCCYVLGREDHA